MSNIIRRVGLYMTVGLLTACVSGGDGISKQSDQVYDTDAAEINMRLGLNYLQQGDYATALDKLERSIEQDPTLPSAQNTIAMLYQQLNENEKAEAHFKKAISLDPKYSEAQNNYGVFLCRQGRYAEAEQRFQVAVENPLYRDKPYAYENMGLCASRALDNVKAEKYFHKALQENPLSVKSILGLAEINYSEGYYQEAADYLERYRAVAPHSPHSLFLNIQVANKLGDKNAVASYKLYLKAHFPDSDEAQLVKKGEY